MTIRQISNRPLVELPSLAEAPATKAARSVAEAAPARAVSEATGLPPPSVSVSFAGVESGAVGFADRLHRVAEHSSSGDDLTTAYLKLQLDELNRGELFESLINQGRHNLRAMAFVEERRLRPLMDQLPSMRAQADQLEEQGRAHAQQGQAALEQQGIQVEDSPTAEQRGKGNFERDLWVSGVMKVDAQIAELVAVRAQAAELRKQGNLDAWGAAEDRAMRIELDIDALFAAVGFTMPPGFVAALSSLHGQPPKPGEAKDLLSRYLVANPAIASELFSSADLQRIGRDGLRREDVASLVAQKQQSESAGDFEEALAHSDEQTIDEVLALYASKYRVDVGDAGSSLKQAAALLAEAYALRSRANNIEARYNLAVQTMGSARTEEQTHGVARRNAEARQALQSSLLPTMRRDEERARLLEEAARQSAEVAKLIDELMTLRGAARKGGGGVRI